MSGSTAELALDARAHVGESPRWDDATETLVWVDITGSRVHRWDPVSGRDLSWDVGTYVGAIALTTSDDVVLAMPCGPARWSPEADPTTLVVLEGEGDSRRLNDAAVDPRGRLVFGSMSLSSSDAEAGRLYSLSTSGCAMLRLGIGLPNGIDWSPSGTTLYFTDSLRGRVDAFEYHLDDGTLGALRSSIVIPRGLPDGHTVDAEGNLWVALWSAGEVACFTPNGRLISRVIVPVGTVTSCAFGGRDLDTLFVTTMQDPSHSDSADPIAGGVFACRPGAVGRQPHRMILDD